MRVSSIVIVGGGSSGWMTAAALSKVFKDIHITLVESSKIGIIGVGESTLSLINKFLKLLDLKDEEWMPFCDATYKNSIRFTNFGKIGSVFEYPFGEIDIRKKYHSVLDWHELRALYPEEYPPESFAKFYNENTYLAEQNKQTRNKNGKLKFFNFEYDTAYHMNSEKFGQYLKNKIAVPNGVLHLEGKVVKWEQDEIGNITKLITDTGHILQADLFVDCTGFKSLLLEQICESPFISFRNVLMNNKAVVAKIPYVNRKTEICNVTNCTAIQNGWVWNIPLWDRIGTGYVYNSDLICEDQAELEFRNHLARKPEYKKRAMESDVFTINIRNGKHREAWVNNVVSVGLSYGFIEPLESNGLMLTHENILSLVEVLSRKDRYVNQFDISTFNLFCDCTFETCKNFIVAHYALSSREDTLYWKMATNQNRYIDNNLDFDAPSNHTWRALFESHFYNRESFNMNIGINYIAAGMGYNRVTSSWIKIHRGDNCEDLEHIKNTWKKYNEDMVEYVRTLPTNYEFLRDNIYGGVDEHLS